MQLMPKLHESYPESYEMCRCCTGSGTKTQLEQIICPECRGSGSIKKRQTSPGRSPVPPKLSPDPETAKSKEELRVQFEQELVKANQLKASLLAAVVSSLLLSAEMVEGSEKVITSIDPLSRSAEARLEELQRDWIKELPMNDPLLGRLREFKISCFAAETYHSLVH